MTETPVCPSHGKPLRMVEEGWLNGVHVTYWGLCPHTHRAGTERVLRRCAREVRVVDEGAPVDTPLFQP